MRKGIIVILSLCMFLLSGCNNVQDAIESSINEDAQGGIDFMEDRLDGLQENLDEQGSEMENMGNALP